MKAMISFKQIDHSDAVKNYVSERAERIERYGLKAMELHITLTKERHLFLAEVELTGKNFHAHTEGSTDDLYASIDQGIERMEKFLQKKTTKVKRSRVRATKASKTVASL